MCGKMVLNGSCPTASKTSTSNSTVINVKVLNIKLATMIIYCVKQIYNFNYYNSDNIFLRQSNFSRKRKVMNCSIILVLNWQIVSKCIYIIYDLYSYIYL